MQSLKWMRCKNNVQNQLHQTSNPKSNEKKSLGPDCIAMHILNCEFRNEFHFCRLMRVWTTTIHSYIILKCWDKLHNGICFFIDHCNIMNMTSWSIDKVYKEVTVIFLLLSRLIHNKRYLQMLIYVYQAH